MRNPNGYGSVVKLSGNRRRPFMVKKTNGFNEKGHPRYEIIGYTATREEGNILLAEFNKCPWDVDVVKITFSELFGLWKEKEMVRLGTANQKSLSSAYGHAGAIWDKPYGKLRTADFRDVIEGCERKSATKKSILNLFHHLDRFALELDVIQKGYAQLVKTLMEDDTKEKTPFTEEEIALLWEHQREPWVDTVLIFLYTGFRISELLDLKTENVNLQEGTFKGGTKTAAGKNRIVPIHSLIRPLVVERYTPKNPIFISGAEGEVVTKNQYYKEWDKVMARLGMTHTPHEARHTFRSRLDSAKANKVCIDLMMGHKSKEIGERTYTHKTIEELKSAIELVTN